MNIVRHCMKFDIISCANNQLLNLELSKIFPYLIFKLELGFMEVYNSYIYHVRNNKEAKGYMIQLKMLGYEINYG